MSLTSGFIALKGQFVDKLPEIFSFFRLVDTGKDVILDDWNAASAIIDKEYQSQNDHSQKRVVWEDNGWTIIEETSFLLSWDQDAIMNITKHYKIPVFTLLTQGTSGSYAFAYYDQDKLREFFVADVEITEDFGIKLPQETGFQINEKIGYNDVHGVGKRFGIDYDNAKNIDRFIIKQFGNNDELEKEIEDSRNRRQESTPKEKTKPWWKLW